MVETDLQVINKDEEVLTGLVQLDTQRELIPVTKKEPQFKDTLTSLLNIPVDKEKLGEMMGGTLDDSVLPENPTMADYLAGAMIMKAALGDTKAYEVVRDTMGQKPVEQIQQDTNIRVVMDGAIKEYGE